MKKLNAILVEKEKQAKKKLRSEAWSEHYRLERGNPVRVYEGVGFVRKL